MCQNSFHKNEATAFTIFSIIRESYLISLKLCIKAKANIQSNYFPHTTKHKGELCDCELETTMAKTVEKIISSTLTT